MNSTKKAVVLLLAAVCLGAALLAGAAEDDGATHALLINGGSKPSSNYQSHLHHLQDLVEVLERRGLPRDRIHVFSADGEDKAPDLAVRETRPDGFWLIEGTAVGRQLRPRTKLTDTRWPGATLRPARKDALRKWFHSTGRSLEPGDRILLFVTDHGNGNTDNPDNGSISLWKEKLTVRELAELLAGLKPGVQVVMTMSQCYSGTFANAIYASGSGEPTGDVCGFYSTVRDLRAYGCYPEGRDRDRIGHAFRFIDALKLHDNTSEAHLEVLLTDSTPDVPVRTSDLYLERLVEDAAESRGLETDVFADRLLAEAWRDRASWEPEIRLLDRIGDAFGTFSPRTLAELGEYERELPALTERMKTYAERWKQTWSDVKQQSLDSFTATRDDWRERLQGESLKQLDAKSREAMLAELLPPLERHAREHAEMWRRLDSLRERTGLASEARWRLDVRMASLRRMRAILTGIAGRTMLAAGAETGDVSRRDAERRALQGLDRCEAFEPGSLPDEDRSLAASHSVALEAFPSLEDDLGLVERVLPSWLGVRFRPVPAALQAGRELPGGASLLDVVYPDSPAIEAGLEVGDIVLGTPDRLFAAARQIREWTMVSPRDTPLPLRVLRLGSTVREDLEFETTVSLRAYPMKWPELPSPPEIGEAAPRLPSGLVPVGKVEWADLRGRPHLLFFWATWCKPCKRAVPELMAFSDARDYGVLAISDEDAETVVDFLQTRPGDFFGRVAVDPRRRSFLGYGVSGTPTIILVDEEGVIRHRQVGYNPSKGLTVEGWSWSPPAQGQGDAASRSSRGSVTSDESP